MKPVQALNHRILVVDDEDLVLTVTETILVRAGATVFRASDGKAALDVVREQGSTLDCALIDLNLVGMGGVALATEIRTLLKDIPLVFMSGFSDAEPQLAAGNTYFIAKPFRRAELLECVGRVLGQR